MREEAESKGDVFTYNRTSRNDLNNSLNLSVDEVNKKGKAGESYVIRFKMPENKEVVFIGLIRREVRVTTAVPNDKVLFKSNGAHLPFANIVDGHLMEILHVIRGEEWLPAAPLHVLLYQALEWKAPEFAHLPIFLKLS